MLIHSVERGGRTSLISREPKYNRELVERHQELKRVEYAMRDHYVICIGILLVAGLYTVLCIIFWQAVAGLPNAVDDDPGLPVTYDLFMASSIILVNFMAYASVRSITGWAPKDVRKPKKKVASKWDKPPSRVGIPAAGRMEGPPASKNADTSRSIAGSK